MDPLRHPDLERLGRSLRDRLDDTLEAEHHAARSAARRRRTLRDRLLEAEDRAETLVLGTTDGHVHRGTIEAVGVDHVVVAEGSTERFVALGHIVTVQAG